MIYGLKRQVILCLALLLELKLELELLFLGNKVRKCIFHGKHFVKSLETGSALRLLIRHNKLDEMLFQRINH